MHRHLHAVAAKRLLIGVPLLLLLLLIVSLAESLGYDFRIACGLRPHRALGVDWIAAHGVVFGCVGVMVCMAVVARLAVVVTW